MGKRYLKSLLVICLISIMVLTMPLSAYAYNTFPFRHRNSTIYYYYDNWVGTRATSYFSKGASAWQEKTTQAVIKHYSQNPGTGYDVYMTAASFSDVSWDGLTTTDYSFWGYVTSQKVTLNMAMRTWNDDNALKSVIVHEMGHIFGLADNGNTRTIMNGYTYGTNSRYETFRLTTPQTDDVNGVNAIY